MTDTSLGTNAKSIDLTPSSAHGNKISAIVGSGGVVAGQSVKWDGSNARTVVACTGISDACIGIARDTVSTVGADVCILGNHCWVQTGLTLTVGGKIEPSTGGYQQNYTSGTVIGTVLESATSASVIKVSSPVG